MASFTAAGAAPLELSGADDSLLTYYSMFGFQRVGDLIWAFADARGRDSHGRYGRQNHAGWRKVCSTRMGHSIVLSSTVPTCAPTIRLTPTSWA